MLDNLAVAIKSKRVILFVGAGVSVGLGLPTWDSLVNHMADELGYDPQIFKSLGAYWTLAEFYKLQKKSIGDLRSWMDVNWHKPDIKIENSEAHKLIVELGFPIIYTTNYDRWLEMAHEHYGKPFKRIVDVNDMQDFTDGQTQIIKFHGDFKSDASIVLTESDYFNRMNFESPLDIRFRSDALAKSVLFIGYSLSDINIRLILYKLWRLWEDAGFSKERPTSYLFLNRPNAVAEQVLKHWGIHSITGDSDNPSHSLVSFLAKLTAALPKT